VSKHLMEGENMWKMERKWLSTAQLKHQALFLRTLGISWLKAKWWDGQDDVLKLLYPVSKFTHEPHDSMFIPICNSRAQLDIAESVSDGFKLGNNTVHIWPL
jgi:hypothetical protein